MSDLTVSEKIGSFGTRLDGSFAGLCTTDDIEALSSAVDLYSDSRLGKPSSGEW